MGLDDGAMPRAFTRFRKNSTFIGSYIKGIQRGVVAVSILVVSIKREHKGPHLYRHWKAVLAWEGIMK